MDPQVASNASNASNASAGVRLSIGTYSTQHKEPSKLDFLPVRKDAAHQTTNATDSCVKSLLHDELTQTLSRARLRQRSEFASVPVPALPLPALPLPSRNTVESTPETSLEASFTAANVRKEVKSAEKLAGKGADRLEEKSCGKYPTVINISGHDSPFDGQRASRREMEKKRKPSAQIQAKMAALAAAAAAGPPDGPLLPPQSPPAPSLALQSHKTFSDSICHTADNKITIQINPYVSQRFQ